MLDHLITELDNQEEAAGIVGELAQILPSEFCSAKSKSFQRGFKDDLPSAKALLH